MHQIGTPETIYKSPADTFVATFVGSPAMNLFKGKLTQSKGRLTFFNENFTLNGVDVPSNLGETDVEIGIRPEDIKVTHGREETQTLRAKVEMISNIGAEKYIHARMGTARTNNPGCQRSRFSGRKR